MLLPMGVLIFGRVNYLDPCMILHVYSSFHPYLYPTWKKILMLLSFTILGSVSRTRQVMLTVP